MTFSVLVRRVGVSELALIRFLNLLLISYVAVAVAALVFRVGVVGRVREALDS